MMMPGTWPSTVQDIQPELPRESRFEEHARRGKTTAKTIFNGSAAVKADASVVREAVAVTVVTLIAPRGVEFIEHRIHKADVTSVCPTGRCGAVLLAQ